MSYLRYLLRRGFYFGLYFLSHFTPRFKNLWVIGNRMGQSYIDHSKYVYEWVLNHGKEIKIVWLTRSDDVYDYLRKRGMPVVKAESFWGYLYSLFASVAIVSVILEDVNKYCIGGAKKVMLWHAIPLKKLRLKEHDKSSQAKLKNMFLGFDNQVYDMIIATYAEPNSIDDFAATFDTPEKNVVVTGYPRNDRFFTGEDEKSPTIEKLRKKVSFSKVVLHLTTFREKHFDQEYDLFLKYGWNSKRMDKLLKKHDAVMIVRTHFHLKTSSKAKKELGKAKRVHVVNNNPPTEDNYILIKNGDVLMGDYGSIFADYLLLDRPIVFVPFDYDYFVNENCQLGYDYCKVTPGPKAYNWQEAEGFLDEILSGKDDYKNFRKRVRNKFHKYQDGNSSKRVVKAIKRLLN